MKLQARLALAVAAAASLAIFIMATAFWVIAADEQRGSDDQQLLTAVSEPRRFAAAAVGGRNNGQQQLNAGRFAEFFEEGQRVRNIFAVIRLVGPNGELLIDEGLPEVDVPEEPTIETIELDGERYRMASGQVGDSGVLQIAINIEEREQSLARLRNRIIFGSALGIGLAALIGAWIARRLSSPIVEVANAARDLAARQDLPSRIEVDRNDEVGELADSFNQMLAALELSRDQQRRLVADASHELRTPLTSLRLKIELLDSTPDLPAEQRQSLLGGAAVELERLTDLVSELVDLATDPTMAEEPVAVLPLAEVIGDVVQEAQRTSGRSITVVADEVAAPIRLRMVRRAVSNLVDNAIKYSPDGTEITVRLSDGRVEVEDRGEGIPADDLELVFDRFYRSPVARTRPGNGIGLAIVHRVADLHHGEVWARNNDDGPGATVGFSVAVDVPSPA